MSCLQHCYGHRRARALERVSAQARAADGDMVGLPRVISGTWDFKWPAGKVIRFAFQKLPDDVDPQLAVRGRALVEEKLQAWLRSAENLPNLDFKLVEGQAPAPVGRTKLGLRWGHSAGGALEYDVLISFLPLPVALPPTEQHPQATIGTSASELGRYAQRIEYGVPTMYLGPWEGFHPSLWFETVEGEFAVVHEIGHALGMPHEQQNPLAYDLPWKTRDEMLRLLSKRAGLARSMDPEAFIEEEIVGRWPGEITADAAGAPVVRFSDWRSPAAIAPDYDFDSVMAKPSYQCLLQGVHPTDVCTEDGCPILQESLGRLRLPTESDTDHLVTMYGPRPVALPVRVDFNSAPLSVAPPSSNKAAAQ